MRHRRRMHPPAIWSAQVIVGGTTFHKSIRIETVKPNRLKIELDLPRTTDARSELTSVTLRSHWLHGAPARSLKARVTVTMTTGSPDFKGYDEVQLQRPAHLGAGAKNKWPSMDN